MWHCYLDEDNMKWIKGGLFKRLLGKHWKVAPISPTLKRWLGICQHASRQHLEFSVLKSSQFRPDLVFTWSLLVLFQWMNFSSLEALGHEAPHSTTQRIQPKEKQEKTARLQIGWLRWPLCVAAAGYWEDWMIQYQVPYQNYMYIYILSNISCNYDWVFSSL